MSPSPAVPAYYPILLQVVIALFITLSMVALPLFLGPRRAPNPAKESPYECGKPAEGPLSPRMTIQFHTVAVLFILFDIETVFFFVWAVVYRREIGENPAVLWGMVFFGLLLLVGLLYELRQKVLDWTR
ncbi:NADH-quinone oxidoreductase subunit A [Candidatus Methylacidithermus pantelleriae]|uniref:NADH-quinone oxidoreductase subunit n=1 Tax=Candidatus Methylacidithermus pantelleriae TaxID=2744239 RepID=A0A8J2FSU5_9BACT|nr:NADH-quinone oxidoreductase subunit A [Candidatus Methylacidithermus pantelleriae]CAF0698776.1 NADH-quinone oxidoreductase subunit A [Candidatus Methylacidithermus pantelleriae]